jgi:hypothetical protein
LRDELGATNIINGVTRNISADGLFVASQDWPWSGASAIVDIQLPRRGPFAQELQLHGAGRIVRVIQDGPQSGFAIVSIPGWTITRNRKPAAMQSV